MKTIVSACGVGFASSTVIAERLKAILERENMTDQVRIVQCTFNEVPGLLDTTNCIVQFSMVGSDYPVPTFNGVPFLTGIGQKELEQQILEVLNNS